jgi:hypothetical protein
MGVEGQLVWALRFGERLVFLAARSADWRSPARRSRWRRSAALRQCRRRWAGRRLPFTDEPCAGRAAPNGRGLRCPFQGAVVDERPIPDRGQHQPTAGGVELAAIVPLRESYRPVCESGDSRAPRLPCAGGNRRPSLSATGGPHLCSIPLRLPLIYLKGQERSRDERPLSVTSRSLQPIVMFNAYLAWQRNT